MYTKKQHIMRKSLIVVSAFVLGVATTALAAAVYDANIQSRADAMLATIRSNASTISASDRPAYYSLVRSNIQSLISVLNTVDSTLATTAPVAPVSPTTPASSTPSGTLALSQNFTSYITSGSRATVYDDK